MRYVCTNTIEAHYQATVEMLKRRLLKRQYPWRLIEKTVSSVQFADRHRYLQPSHSSHPFIKKPIFKCLPPPQFSTLKATILHHYHLIQHHTPHPRLIALRHKTLKQELVRAHVKPSDEQLVDIILLLGNYTTLRSHITAGTMPMQHKHETVTLPCNLPKCITCTHLNCNKYFRSTSTGINYQLRHSFTCASSNIIYLITCTKCRKQYVGLTTNQLNQRINRHRTNIINNRTIYICIHFNFPDHSLKQLVSTNNRHITQYTRTQTIRTFLDIHTTNLHTKRT